MFSEGKRLQREVAQYIEACAASSCRELCNTMQEKLPRELRDMVYQELLQDSLHCVATADYDPTFRSKGATEPSTMQRYPHLSNPECVGKETLIEMAETWYRLCDFRLGFRSDAARLLGNDLWSLGLDSRHYIRQITLHILPFDCPPYTTSVRMADNVDLLRKLRKLSSVKIMLSIHHWDYSTLGARDVELFVHQIAYIFPILRSMLDTGCRITGVVEGAGQIKLEAQDLNEARWCQLVREGHTIRSLRVQDSDDDDV